MGDLPGSPRDEPTFYQFESFVNVVPLCFYGTLLGFLHRARVCANVSLKPSKPWMRGRVICAGVVGVVRGELRGRGVRGVRGRGESWDSA